MLRASKRPLPGDFSQQLAQLCAPPLDFKGEAGVITTMFMCQAESIIPLTGAKKQKKRERAHVVNLSSSRLCVYVSEILSECFSGCFSESVHVSVQMCRLLHR